MCVYVSVYVCLCVCVYVCTVFIIFYIHVQTLSESKNSIFIGWRYSLAVLAVEDFKILIDCFRQYYWFFFY